MTALINIFVVGFIALTYWFFFMKKEKKAVMAENEIVIKVAGGYSPSVVKLRKGQRVTLKFHRTDGSSCLEEVVLPEFGVREFLPLNQTVEITIKPKKAGVFNFVCGMNMFHGRLEVTEA